MSMVLDNPFTKNIDGEMLTKDYVIRKYKDLVHSIALKHKKRAIFFGFEYEDVVSEGNVGLIKAYRDFKNEYGFKFMTYAYAKIEGEIKRHIRDNCSGPKFYRRIKEYALKVGLENDPTEIANQLNINMQEANEVWVCKHKTGAISLDKTVQKSQEKEMTMKDLLPSYEDYTSIFANDFLQHLENKKPRYIEVLQYVLEGKNQIEISKIIGVSQVQVSRNIKEIRGFYRSFMKEVV
jgi:RNA polymerase sigma factor (sigma-70 family)